MVGSIDPRCETVRGTHWPKPGRVVVWSSRRGNHLGQRFKPTASKGRTYGCKRSDQAVKKLLCHGGPSTYGSRIAFAEPVIGRAFARPVGSLVRDDGDSSIQFSNSQAIQTRIRYPATRCARVVHEPFRPENRGRG